MNSKIQDRIDAINARLAELKVQHPEYVARERFIIRGGRTGKKFHIGVSGSSILGCGKWVKYNVDHYRVRDTAQVPDHALCSKCFPQETK